MVVVDGGEEGGQLSVVEVGLVAVTGEECADGEACGYGGCDAELGCMDVVYGREDGTCGDLTHDGVGNIDTAGEAVLAEEVRLSSWLSVILG